MYPAYRSLARVRRLVLRARAAAGIMPVQTVRSNGWALGDFARDALPGVASAVALVGTPGPTQKVTVQLWDAKGNVIGYLKYAESEIGRKGLRQESRMLASIPGGYGPEPLKHGDLGNGEALLVSCIPGKLLPAKRTPSEDMIRFLTSLPTSLPSALEDHPWVRSTLGKSGGELDDCLGALGGKDWPVVVQHGDFVPWNLLRRPDGSLGAIDWEFGTLRGFPHLDLAYYTLQVAALIYRWTPSKAAEYTIRYLTSHARFDLESAEARALTRFAAYGVYQRFREEGKPSHQIPRTWWRAVWEERS